MPLPKIVTFKQPRQLQLDFSLTWTAININFICHAEVVQIDLLFYFTILAYRLFVYFQPVPIIQNDAMIADVLDIFRSLMKNAGKLNSMKFQI